MTPGAAQWILAAGLAAAAHLAVFYYSATQNWRAAEQASGAPETVWGLTQIALTEDAKPTQTAMPQKPVEAGQEIAPVNTDALSVAAPAEQASVAAPEAVEPLEPKSGPKPAEEPEKKKKRAKPKPKTRPASSGPVGRAAGRDSQRSSRAGGASFSNYAGRVAAHLRRYKRYPSSAGRASGTARVAFSLSRAGGLRSVRLAGSSGNTALDRAAVDMVRRANPFPSMPSNLNRNSASFSVPIRFSR